MTVILKTICQNLADQEGTPTKKLEIIKVEFTNFIHNEETAKKFDISANW